MSLTSGHLSLVEIELPSSGLDVMLCLNCQRTGADCRLMDRSWLSSNPRVQPAGLTMACHGPVLVRSLLVAAA